MNKRIPELLSPAGNLQCAVAAFEGGADAIYCGLSRFNPAYIGKTTLM